MIERARQLLKKLNFEECIVLYERLDAGNPMINLVFERMEEIDAVRFDEWL